ncbi:MAG: ferritin-like domain-containing protein [Deltaproteobacteria bacterium]|nr:ferritin-like domain-containing protein [Deltaproteobacteria bacterium]
MSEMMNGLSELPHEVRKLAGENWAFRWNVERDAHLRFARMSGRLTRFGSPEGVVALARKAADDEVRHTQLCATLAERYGAPVDPSKPASIHEVSPSRLAEPESLTYEIIAACCVTETESAGVLTTLLASEPDPLVRETLHAIARDEVDHSRLGWAHLAHARTVQKLDFMSELLPVILGGTVDDSLFQPAKDPALESPLLVRAGILPHTQKREVFVRMLREVVFPGLESNGIDPSFGKAWLDARA